MVLVIFYHLNSSITPVIHAMFVVFYKQLVHSAQCNLLLADKRSLTSFVLFVTQLYCDLIMTFDSNYISNHKVNINKSNHDSEFLEAFT